MSGLTDSDKDRLDNDIDGFSEALRLNPKDAATLTCRGNAYYGLGECERAIQDYDEAIRLDPENSNALENRGHAYFNTGHYQQAIQDYDKAILLDPENSNAYRNRGHAYFNTGHYQQAIQDYDEVIRLDPENSNALEDRGDSYAELGQYEQAIQDYDKAILLDPENSNARYGRDLARADLRHDEADQKVDDAKKAIVPGSTETSDSKCDHCGETIPRARLKAVAGTSQCVKCATKFPKETAGIPPPNKQGVDINQRSSSIPAGFESWCPACEGRIKQGDQILNIRGSWLHAYCADR